jgi:hypothetical protein
MTLTDFKEWLSPMFGATYYVGVLDKKKDCSIGFYQLHRLNEVKPHVGGGAQTSTKGISLLVHWTKSSTETEAAAQGVYDLIRANCTHQQIGRNFASYIRLLNREPLDVGQDENGVFERVIEMEIYYQENGA